MLALDPETADIDVPEFAGALPLRDGQCCGGVRVDYATLLNSEIPHSTSGANQLSRALTQPHELSLC